MKESRHYYLFLDQIKTTKEPHLIEEYLIFQFRGQFPYANMLLNKMEVIELIDNLTKIAEEMK